MLLHRAAHFDWLKKDLLVGDFWSQLLESVRELIFFDLLVTRIGVISNNDRYMLCEMHLARNRLQCHEEQSKNL